MQRRQWTTDYVEQRDTRVGRGTFMGDVKVGVTGRGAPGAVNEAAADGKRRAGTCRTEQYSGGPGNEGPVWVETRDAGSE